MRQITKYRDGDMIEIDARAGVSSITLDIAEDELAARRASLKLADPARHGGLLEKYAAVVRGANKGAVTHSGAVDTSGDLT